MDGWTFGEDALLRWTTGIKVIPTPSPLSHRGASRYRSSRFAVRKTVELPLLIVNCESGEYSFLFLSRGQLEYAHSANAVGCLIERRPLLIHHCGALSEALTHTVRIFMVDDILLRNGHKGAFFFRLSAGLNTGFFLLQIHWLI